ncbi:MAG: LCP family protein [Lachnospiraceae bacterium]|nr:LCP family protein [Lachnospiraceae bacterium]
MKKDKSILPSLLLFLIAIGCTAAAVFLFARYFSNRNSDSEDGTSSQARSRTITLDGETYSYNYNLTNILFMGIDKGEEAEYYAASGWAGQADCVMLFSLDSETKESRILQISRDTMTEIDIYDVDGKKFNTMTAQLTLQYAYGLGAKQSCLAMKTTVGELLEGVTINAYVSLDISALPIINDAVGGVTLTLDADYTDVDESYTEGAVITLDGEAAEHFVRYRDITVTGSNNTRMQRQVLYLTALIQTISDKLDNPGDLYDLLYPLVSDYMVTDLTADEINEFASYSFRADETEYAPGEVVEGEEHDEFYLDEDAFLRLIVDMFYQ